MLYLDANVFIFAAYEEGERGVKARQILSRTAKNGQSCATATLAWDEVFWAIKKEFGREKAKEQSEKLLSLAGIQFVPVEFEILKVAQQLVERYPLAPRDAIHVATALKSGCEAIVTTDPDFDKIKEIKIIKL